jgi:hypothetical protein
VASGLSLTTKADGVAWECGAARRLEDGSFNLNLSYIDARLIAMGMPTDSLIQKMTRNPAAEVARFLETRHRLVFTATAWLGCHAAPPSPARAWLRGLLLAAHTSECCSGHYRIYNLCVESYAHYNPAQARRRSVTSGSLRPSVERV